MSIGTRGINRQRPCSQRLSLRHGSDSHQRNVCRAAIVWSREAISCRSAVRSASNAFSASSCRRRSRSSASACDRIVAACSAASVAFGQHPVALGQLAVAQRDQLLALLPRRVQLGELTVLVGDDPFAFGNQRFQVMDVRGLPVQRRVAILEQRVLPEHFAGIGLRALLLGLFGVGEKRPAHRRGRKRGGRPRGNDDEVHAFRRHIRRHPARIAEPGLDANALVFAPDRRPGRDVLMEPALRRKRLGQQLGQAVAIELVAMELVDVIRARRYRAACSAKK